MFITVGEYTINAANITFITRTGALIVIHFVGVDTVVTIDGPDTENFLKQLAQAPRA